MKYITILLLLFLVSCGTRKRDIHVSTIKKDVVLTQNNDITTNIKETRTSTTVIYSPVDPTKPMVLPDGRTSINTKIEEKSTQEDNNVVNIDKSTSEIKDNSKEKDKAVHVETEKPNPYKWIGLWIAVIIIAFCAIYFYPRWSGVFNKK